MVEIANLITLCPTDDESKALRAFKGDRSRLGAPERMMLALIDVPQARARAEALRFQSDFDERLKDAQEKLAVVDAALVQITNASRLRRFLKAVLVLGNHMNGVTMKARKGLVKAFTLNSLHQLHLTKANDSQTTVLQYQQRILKRRDPDLLRLSVVSTIQ